MVLERKAGRGEVQEALKLKADTADVQRCLDQKANLEELQELVTRLVRKHEESVARLEALIEAKVPSLPAPWSYPYVRTHRLSPRRAKRVKR